MNNKLNKLKQRINNELSAGTDKLRTGANKFRTNISTFKESESYGNFKSFINDNKSTILVVLGFLIFLAIIIVIIRSSSEPEPEPQPAQQPAPQPATEPAPQPATEPATQPATQPANQDTTTDPPPPDPQPEPGQDPPPPDPQPEPGQDPPPPAPDTDPKQNDPKPCPTGLDFNWTDKAPTQFDIISSNKIMCNNNLYSTGHSNYTCSSGSLEPTPVCVPTNINIYKNQYQKCNEYIKDNYAIPAYGYGNLNSETWMSCGAGGNMEKEINNFEQLCNLWYQTFDVTENNNEIDYGNSTDTIKAFINDVCTPTYKPPEKNYTCPVPPNRITWVSPQPYKNQDNITSDMMKCLDKDHIIDDNGTYKCDSNGKLTPTPTCIPVTTGNSDGDSVDSSGNDGSNNEGNCADQPWKNFNTLDKFSDMFDTLPDTDGIANVGNSEVGSYFCKNTMKAARERDSEITDEKLCSIPTLSQACRKTCDKCTTPIWTRQDWINNITLPEPLNTNSQIGADFNTFQEWINAQEDDDTNNDDTNNDDKCIDQPWKAFVNVNDFWEEFNGQDLTKPENVDTAGSQLCNFYKSSPDVGCSFQGQTDQPIIIQSCRNTCDKCTTTPWSRQEWIDKYLKNAFPNEDPYTSIGADFESLSEWINEEKTIDTVTPEIENKIAVNKNINLAKSDSTLKSDNTPKSDNTLNSTCKDEPWKVYKNMSEYDIDNFSLQRHGYTSLCEEWKDYGHCEDERLDIQAACLLSCSSPSPNGYRYININGKDKLCSDINYKDEVGQYSKYKDTAGVTYDSEKDWCEKLGSTSKRCRDALSITDK